MLKENDVQKEQEKLARASEHDTGGSVTVKIPGCNRTKRSYMVADEEEAFSEAAMHRRILKLSFLNTIQRRHIKQHQKNIEVFEQAFATIKSSTGISDIEEIVKIFIALEQRNFSLLTYVNQLNREIEAIEIRNNELRAQLKARQEQEMQSEERKELTLSEVKTQITKTRAATLEKDKMIADSAAALDECRPLIWNVVKLLKQEIPSLCSVGYEGDAPPMKVAPPDEHESQLNHHLMYIEEALLLFRLCLAPDALQRTAPGKPIGAGVKKPSDLPSAHMGDDSDEDPESGLFDRPWTRSELRKRALEQLTRRRKLKPQGKPPHEDRKAEVVDDADATRRDAPVLPSSATAKDSPDNALEKPSAMVGGKDQLVPEEEPAERKATNRDELWWRNQGRERKK